MQNTQHPPRSVARLFGLAVGASGFFLSLVLAVTLLVRQGNPGFLLIWLAAAFATFACMRAHVRWRRAFERMYAPDAVRTYYPARRGWRHEVEDIAFRDIPDASVSFGQ